MLPLLALLAAVPAADARVLVLEVQAVGVDQSVGAQLSPMIADTIAALPGFKVMTAAELKEVADVVKTREVLGCESDAACIAELSKQANAELVVHGTVGRIGDELVVTLALIESKNSHVRNRLSEPLGDELAGGVRGLVARLFGVETTAAKRFQLPDGVERSFAVLDLKTAGVSEDIAKNLTQVLSTTLKQVDGASVVSRADVYALLELEREKDVLGCAGEEECLAEIGGALGVEHLVLGQVGKVAGSYVISLRLVNSSTVQVLNRVTEAYEGDERQLMAALRFAARSLVGIDAGDGGLTVAVTEEGAEVFVDGKSVGVSPVRPIDVLSTGRHSVRVSRGGFIDWVGDVYVDPAASASLFVELERRPSEWYQTWWFWTATAGGVAAIAAGVGTAAVVAFGGPTGINVSVNADAALEGAR